MGCIGRLWQVQSTYLNKKRETERQKDRCGKEECRNIEKRRRGIKGCAFTLKSHATMEP